MAAARTIHFEDGVVQIRIGRRTDLELSLPYSALSGVHARLVRPERTAGDHRWMVEDLGSTNGTFLEGERLKPGVKHAVTAGTQIKLAEIQLIFEGEVQAAEATVLAVDPKVASPEPKVPAAPARVPTPMKIPAAPARAPTAELKIPAAPARVPTAELKVPAAAGRVPTAELKLPAAAGRVTPAELKVPAAEAKVTPAEAKAPPAEPTQTFVRRKTSELAVSGARPVTAVVPFLSAVGGLGEGATTFRLEQHDHVYMFGRTRRCEFRVKTGEVSREHATFTRRSDGIYVNDLGSVNGVLVNNTRVSEFRLYDGDLITVGRVKLRLFDPTETGRRATDSVSGTPSRLAPPDAELRHEAPPAPERSASFHSELHPARSDLHPAIAGHLASEGIYEGGHRQRRPSVRVRLTESWDTSSRFRYGIVIVAAAVLAFVAVSVGFRLAG